MKEDSGLVFGFLLDGAGGGKKFSFDDVKNWSSDHGTLWLHLDYTVDKAKNWLYNESGLDPIIVESLVTEETRPRSLVHKSGMLVILRGVNLNPESDPEDMVSVRLWIDSNLIVTLYRRNVMAITELREAVENGSGPTGSGAFLEDLSDRLVVRMGSVIADIDDSVDALEDEVLSEQNYELRRKISDIRRTAIAMRRYVSPQRDVIAHLYNEKVDWLNEIERMRIRETADRTTRYIEDLDSVRDRATVTQEELNNRLAEQMNKTMYVLAIVAGVFLPLGLLTGLFGINIGGMPGTDSKWAFAIFCILLLMIATVQIWFFKKKKWM